MRADLHLHSVWSDGKYTPGEIARRVKEAGVSLFSLTDHDTMGGCDEAAEAARRLGLRFVCGWEISAYRGDIKLHILGYGCRADGTYRRFSEELRAGARIRAAEIIRLANAAFGLDVTAEEAERYHARKEAPLHGMHIVRAFAARLGCDAGELYRAAFAPGRPAFSPACRPSPEAAVEVIHRTGGLAVLAHPGRICFSGETEKLADGLVAAGLDGIECFYTTHTVTETERFLSYAKARGLLVTGGSDFHAEGRAPAVGLPAFEADAVAERLLLLEGSV